MMGKSEIKIEDLSCCPHCGGSFGYYTVVRSKGKWHDTTRFDHKTKENTEMMDSFSDTWESKHIYCSECRKPICKRHV
jgi:hypothetical protein